MHYAQVGDKPGCERGDGDEGSHGGYACPLSLRSTLPAKVVSADRGVPLIAELLGARYAHIVGP